MKLRKILSMVITAVIVMTNAVIISRPAVSAETVNTAVEYSEDFLGFDNKNFSPTLQALGGYGWYVADHNTLYTQFIQHLPDKDGDYKILAPYSTYSQKFAKINSQSLRIFSAGEQDFSNYSGDKRANVRNYGYAKTFPGVAPGEAVTGVWEINFDFKPSLINNKTQFSFTFNTADSTASNETVARHNIISGYNQSFYLGYRDYAEALNKSITPCTVKASDAGGLIWYSVKTVLNCDARYYSVELYNKGTGALIARRSPISFDEKETIGFLKFSALGYDQASYVDVDNISIKKAVGDPYIYNETFEDLTGKEYTIDPLRGMSTGGATEDLKGTSYFTCYTPWRYHSDIGSSYAIEDDDTLESKVVRLGDLPSTADVTEASGLIYMPAKDSLLTAETESLRGMLRASFKIKPETVTGGFCVNVISNVSEDIANDDFALFRIINNNGTPCFVEENGEYTTLDASAWYDVEMTFDVVCRKVKTKVKSLAGAEIASNTVTGDAAPYAVKAVMFKAADGSSVLIDDIKFEYCAVCPSVDESRIVLKDRFGGTVTDTNNVTTALKTIEIPMGCPIDGETANSSSILLRDSGNNAVAYTGTAVGNSYVMELNSALSLNEEYTLTVPGTVANTNGDVLGTEVIYTFNTVNEIIDISGVTVNGTSLDDLSNITEGSSLNVALKYDNGGDTAVNSKVILAFYGGGRLINMQTADYTMQAGAHGTDSVSFTVPENMNKADSMAVLVWDGVKYLSPISRKINVERKSGGKYKDYVDFEVNIESGREAVILQLTDPQIMDAVQSREYLDVKKEEFWAPCLMNKRLFIDLRNLIEGVKPDLILLTGDLVYGKYDDEGTSFKKFADFMDSFGIPWAPVFGNHDNESAKGADWQCSYFESCENCLFKQRTLTGNGNYSIGIVQGGELKRVIFMLDSNGCGAMSDATFGNGHSKKSGGFGDDQIAWYTGAAEKINRDFKDIKYTFAFHIQPAAFEDAFYNTYGFVNGGEVDEANNLKSPLNIDEREDKRDTDFGYIGRNLKTPWDQDKAVYNGMKALGADSILVGHEHCNSASVVYDGVRFQYGQKIGEYDRINFRSSDGNIIGYIAVGTDQGTPILGGTVLKLSQLTGEISDAYIHYCDK